MDMEKVLSVMLRGFKMKMNNTGNDNGHNSGQHKGCLELITTVIYIWLRKLSSMARRLQLFLGLVGLIFTSDTVIPSLNF